MQLDGLLSRFALRELLELGVASLVSGAIEVQAPAGVHRIFFVEGVCVHVTGPDASGFEALWPLFELQDAPFRFVAGDTTREHTITEPTQQVIDQAEALAREWTRLRPHIPHLGIVPQLATPTGGEQVRIYEEDWPVLTWVDGMRTIREVARAAMLDPLEVSVGLLRLKERGLVDFSAQPVPAVAPEPHPPTARHARPAKSTTTARPTSFFARLLTGVPQDMFIDSVATDEQPVPAVTAAAQTAAAPPPSPGSSANHTAAPAPISAPAPAQPVTEYDDILRLLRA